MLSTLFYSTRETQELDQIGAPFRIFQTSILLQNVKKLKRGPFADIENFSENKSHKARTRHKCVPGRRGFRITRQMKIFEKSKKVL